MNTATQLGGAQATADNLLTQAGGVAPPAPAMAGEEASADEALLFDEQMLLALVPMPTDDTAATESTPLADPLNLTSAEAPGDTPSAEDNLQQVEALLGLFGAQQRQQVQAQASTMRTGNAPATTLSLTTGAPPAQPTAAEAPVVAMQQPTSSQPDPVGATPALRPDVLAVAAHEGPLTPDSLAVAGTTRTAAERLVKLEGTDTQRGEQMLQALRNNVQLQLQSKQQIATIRLDPPELGSLEIQVSQESGRISVQISAAQADTLRLLQMTSDRLRHELLNQQFVQVNVQVGGEGHTGQQSRGNRGDSDETLVRANPLDNGSLATGQSASSDVLATV